MDMPYEVEQNAVKLLRDGSTRVYVVDAANLPAGKTAVMNDEGGRALYGDDDWELALEGYHPEITVTRVRFTTH